MTFRYYDEARKLSEELAEIKVEPRIEVAKVAEPNDSLERIARGDTALQGMGLKVSAEAAEDCAKKERVRAHLTNLLKEKRSSIDTFIAESKEIS